MKTPTMNRGIRKPEYGAGAFSLLELLVAIAVLAIITILLAVVLERASGVWSRAVERIEVQREALVALESLATDISQAVRHLPRSEWMVVRRATDEDVQVSPGAPVSALPADWLVLLGRSPGEQGSQGDTTQAIVYRVAYASPVVGNKPFFGLYRSVTSGRDTLQHLSQNKPLNDYTSAAGALVSPDVSRLLAKYVLGFSVAFEVAEADGRTATRACNPGDEPLSVSDKGVFQGGVRIGDSVTALQVSLALVPKTAAEKLPEISSSSEKDRLIGRKALCFTKYIPLQTR